MRHLRALGMGACGEVFTGEVECLRCAHLGMPPREFLPGASVNSDAVSAGALS